MNSSKDKLSLPENYYAIQECFNYATTETDLFSFMSTIATMLDVFSSAHDLTLEDGTEMFNIIERMRKERYAEEGHF